MANHCSIIFSIYAYHFNVDKIKDILIKNKWDCNIYDNDDDPIHYFSKSYIYNDYKIILLVSLYDELIPAEETADIVFVDEDLPAWVYNRYSDWADEKELGEVMWTGFHFNDIEKHIKYFSDYAKIIFNYYNKED